MGIQTIDEVAREISKDLPEWQFRANRDWLMNLHYQIKEGGVWVSPALGTIYTKVEHGFVKLEGDMKHMRFADTPEV